MRKKLTPTSDVLYTLIVDRKATLVAFTLDEPRIGKINARIKKLGKNLQLIKEDNELFLTDYPIDHSRLTSRNFYKYIESKVLLYQVDLAEVSGQVMILSVTNVEQGLTVVEPVLKDYYVGDGKILQIMIVSRKTWEALINISNLPRPW